MHLEAYTTRRIYMSPTQACFQLHRGSIPRGPSWHLPIVWRVICALSVDSNDEYHIPPFIDILPKQSDSLVEIPPEKFMRKQKDEPIDMLQGTLDMLILRTLLFGPIHGHAIAKSIEQTSLDVLRVDHGS